MKDIRFIEGPLCIRCGRSLEVQATCADCYRRADTYFFSNRSGVHYNEKMKSIISLYKYRGHEVLHRALTELLVRAYFKHYSEINFDCVTFVPLHPKRLQERGFNQAQQLAISFGLRMKLPVRSLLVRRRDTEKQSKKDKLNRLRTLANVFEYLPSTIPLRKVLLIDDIYTTGTTINECAKALAKNGEKVYSLTVAR